MRRLSASVLAAGLAVAVNLAAAAPAHAGTASVQFTTPGPNLPNLTTSTFEFRATVSTASGTLRDKVYVDLVSSQGRPGTSFDQDTNDRPSIEVVRTVTLGWNGAYQANVRAAAKSGVFDEAAYKTSTFSFTVDAPPAVPAGVKATTDSKTRVVTVSWTANTEADMVGYEVERQSSNGVWTSLAVTDATNITDESTANAGGTYRYQVRALRQSAQAGKLNPSGFSSSASTTVPVPPVPPTPTTTVPSGTGSGNGATTTTPGGTTGGTTGGGGSATEGGSSGGSTTVDGARSGGPLFGSGSGKVDLSDFQALLKQSQQHAGSPAAGAGDEGTFDERLPFKARTGGDDDEDDDDGTSDEALGDAPAGEGVDPQALGFLAGGLLATVLLMHVIWVRSEVHRAEALEALTPAVVDEAPPAGRRRRPPSPAAR